MKKLQRWSTEMRRNLEYLLKQGYGSAEICEKLVVSMTALYTAYFIKKMGMNEEMMTMVAILLPLALIVISPAFFMKMDELWSSSWMGRCVAFFVTLFVAVSLFACLRYFIKEVNQRNKEGRAAEIENTCSSDISAKVEDGSKYNCEHVSCPQNSIKDV